MTSAYDEYIQMMANEGNKQRHEFDDLVAYCKQFSFTHSAQVSQQIKREKLGARFPTLSGHITMTDGRDDWDFDGGISPVWYRRLCEALNLNNNGSRSWVKKFDPYQNQLF
ncbi:hypothetical protein [Vibrio sp. WXL210]|uniref:hypothetical protein n=1 Tax=Vibrio sp. WXL210 TaxID=3450709 RepID=UPI003EC6F4E9